MKAYRIGLPIYPLLSGIGAAANDSARWNFRGRYVIYAAEHYSTAVLEKAAQCNAVRLPRALVYIEIDVPDDVSVEEVQPDALPGWDADNKIASQRFGTVWYEDQRSLILFVPSMVAPGLERNVLINERHPEFSRVTASAHEPVRCHPHLLVDA